MFVRSFDRTLDESDKTFTYMYNIHVNTWMWLMHDAQIFIRRNGDPLNVKQTILCAIHVYSRSFAAEPSARCE